MKSQLFLDTTIQIDRATKKDPENSHIKKVISAYQEIISSSYVKMEYKRRYIRDLIYLNSLVQDLDSMGEIFLRLSKLLLYQGRKLGMVLAHFATSWYETDEIVVKGALGEEVLEILRLYLPEAIEAAWEKFDDVLTDDLLNETNCYLAKERPQRKGQKFDRKIHHCERAAIRCDIVKFLETHRDSFKKILDTYANTASLDNEQTKAKKMLQIVLKIPEEIASHKKCWKLGDVINNRNRKSARCGIV